MQGSEHSWLSILGTVAVLYWIVYFMNWFFTVVKDSALILFIFLCVIVGLLIKAFFRWFAKTVIAPTVVEEDDEHSSVMSTQPLPFFVKGQVRRRKLDVTRSSNFVSDSVGKKQKRQVSGIMRKKRKRGGK